MNTLQNKVAIITGSSRGIGRAIALRFADEGAKTIVTYCKSKNQGRAVYDEIAVKGGETFLVKVDISDFESVRQMVKKTIDTYGRIDILVNNAGVAGSVGPLHTTSLEDWKKTFEVNLNGVFYCCREVVPHMIEQKFGRIINFSSKGGLSSHPLTGPYNATKAAILNLTRTLSAEIAYHGITVNCIIPGLINTDMAREGIAKIADLMGTSPDQMYDGIIKRNHFKRGIEIREVVEAVLFLASERSSGITSESIDISGGGL